MTRINGPAAPSTGRLLLFLLPLLFRLTPGLAAQEFRFAEPVRYLGMTYDEAVEELGLPESIYPFRGETPKQDTVVFYYPEHVYLYWIGDRVWQVRFDHRFEGAVLGLGFDDDRLEVERLLGKPAYKDEVSIVAELGGTSYPVRARIFFAEDTVHDIYIYRGDY